MKLNLGSGPYYATGWTNVEYPGTQYRCDLEADFLAPLPPEITNVEAVYMGHFLEHLPLGEIPAALRALRDRMVPDAPIAVVGPDTERAYDMFTRGVIPFSLYELCKKHDNPTPGHSHLWDCTEDLVVHLLSAAGFASITPVNLSAASRDPAQRHIVQLVLGDFPVTDYAAWQCAVLAKAPTPPAHKIKKTPKMAQPR